MVWVVESTLSRYMNTSILSVELIAVVPSVISTSTSTLSTPAHPMSDLLLDSVAPMGVPPEFASLIFT